MHEIDLIPQDYRLRLARIRDIKVAVVVISLALVLCAAIALLTRNSIKAIENDIASMQARNSVSQQQQEQLAQLILEEQSYESQWSLLRGLRAGAAAEDIFAIIEQALDGRDLWFVSWEFRRAGVIIAANERGVETGYFIVVQTDVDATSDKPWMVETHMTIRGQAKDHQALSTFVRALFEQEKIKDVSVGKTSQISYADGRAIDFDMTVILNSELIES